MKIWIYVIIGFLVIGGTVAYQYYDELFVEKLGVFKTAMFGGDVRIDGNFHTYGIVDFDESEGETEIRVEGTPGWSGTCYPSGNLIVKKGIVVDCELPSK